MVPGKSGGGGIKARFDPSRSEVTPRAKEKDMKLSAAGGRILVAFVAAVTTFGICFGAPVNPSIDDASAVDVAYAEERTRVRNRIMSPSKGYSPGLRTSAFSAIDGATSNEGKNLTCVVEGDIRICNDPEETSADGGVRERGKRQTVNRRYYDIWSSKVINYAVDASTYQSPGTVAAAIRSALDSWESKTCVRFTEIPLPADAEDHSTNYLRVFSGSGCWSDIGKTGGRQDISLAEQGCIYKGVIMHEFGHSMGLIHQQARPDRDGYVDILANNIMKGCALNFLKNPWPTILKSTPYDLESVMHYGLSSFATSKATIRPKSMDYASLAGNRASATHYDYQAISSLYNCKGNCRNACDNDGYPLQNADGSCTCICPYGLGGPNCSSYDQKSFTCGGVVSLDNRGAPFVLNAVGGADGSGKCAWLFKAPEGSIVKVSFSNFNVLSNSDQCTHYVEVRRNLIGQSGPILYCGTGNPDDLYSRNDFESNAVMVIFDYTAAAGSASSFTAKVSSYSDGCLGDPCRGAPCQSSAGSRNYTCLLPSNNVMCGFENLLSRNCTALNMNAKDNETADFQRTWEVIDAGSILIEPSEGAYFISSKAQEDPSMTSKGIFGIIPHDFKNADRCLMFKYLMKSADSGTINVYRSVNGNRGKPIFTYSAPSVNSPVWLTTSLNITKPATPKDLIEILFEAVHQGGGSDSSIIAVDDIRYFAGACPTGACSSNPCGTATCVENASGNYSTGNGVEAGYTCLASHPDTDASCNFEDWEDCSSVLSIEQMVGDKGSWTPYKWRAPGRKWPYSTGPSGAATGFTYLYAKLNDKQPKDRARLKTLPYRGDRCLRFKFSMNGVNCGSLKVYRAVNGNYDSSILLWSAYGNQGSQWLQAAVNVTVGDLAPNATVEVIIEAVHGDWGSNTPGYYAADVGLDDVYYTSGTCDRLAGTIVQSPLSIPTTTTAPRCSWVWKTNKWVWTCY